MSLRGRVGRFGLFREGEKEDPISIALFELLL